MASEKRGHFPRAGNERKSRCEMETVAITLITCLSYINSCTRPAACQARYSVISVRIAYIVCKCAYHYFLNRIYVTHDTDYNMYVKDQKVLRFHQTKKVA